MVEVLALIDRGYDFMSYDGQMCLDDSERTSDNVLNGELTHAGARLFEANIRSNLEGVMDVQIVKSSNGNYDVYAKVLTAKKAVGQGAKNGLGAMGGYE